MIDNQSAEQPDPVQEKASSEGGMAGLLRLKLKDDGPGDMVSMLGRLGVSPERLKAPRTDLTGDEQNQLFIEGVDRAFDSGEYNQYTLAGPMAEATMKQVGIPDAISEFTGGVIGEINALLNFRGQLLNTATNWTTGKDYDEVLPGWLYKSIGLPSNPGMSGADAIEAQLPEGMSAQERMASIGGESVARDLGGAGTQVMTAIGLSLIPGGQAAAAANTARAAGVVGRLLGPVKQFVKSPGGKLYMGYMGGRQMAESSKEYREYVENQNKYADMYNEALDYLELPFDKIDKDEYSLATDVMTSVGSGAMTAASELIGTGFSVMAGRRIGSRLLPSVFKGNVADRVAYRGMGGLIAQMAKGGVTASAMEGFEEVVDGFGQAVIRGWYSEFERGRFMRTGNPGDLWKTIQQHAPDLAYQFAIAATVTLPLGIGGSLAVARRDNRTLEAFAEARLRDRLAEGEGVESGVADHVASKVIYDHAMGQGDKDQVAIRAAVQQLRGRMEEVGNVTEDMLMDPEFAARFVEAFPELAFKIGQSESLSRTQLQWLTGQNTTSSGARQAFLDRVRRGSNDQVGAYVAEWVRRSDTRLKEIRGRLAELNRDNSEEGRSERTKLSYEASRIQSVREGFEDLIAAREQISGEEFRQAVEGLSVSLEGIDPTGSADATQDSRATEQYESGIPDQEGPTSADLRRLARQGDSDAALELARRHETGDRAEPHEAKARYWFNVALSQAGDTDAMVYLGMVYEGRIQAESPGAPRSINKARDLYRRAFEMGNDEAGRLLGELEQRLAGPAPRARADAATSRSGPSAGVQTPQAPREPEATREAPKPPRRRRRRSVDTEGRVPRSAVSEPQAETQAPPRDPVAEATASRVEEGRRQAEQAERAEASRQAEAEQAELTAEEQRLNEEVAKGAKRDDLRVRIVGRDTDTPLQKKVRAAAKKLGRKVEFIRITQEESRPGQRRRRSPSGIRGFVSRNSDTIYIVAVTENQASRLEQDVLKDHYLQTLLHEVAHGLVQDKTIREQVEQLLTKELADSFRSRFMLGDTAEEIREELAVYTLTQDIVGSRGVESLIMGSESFKAFRKVADSLVGLVEAILPKNQRAQLLKRVLKDRVTVTKKAKEVSKDNPARESVDEGRAAKPQPKPQAEPKIAARQETKPTQEDRTSPQPKPVWQMTSAEFLREFEFVKGMGSTSSPWGVVRDGQSVQGSAVQAKDGTGRKISVRPYFFKTKKAAVESMRELHRQSVEGAIRNGRDVPSNVRAELETKPTPTREATTRKPAARPKATPPQESRPNQDGPPVARARLKTEEGFVPDKFKPELQKGYAKQSSIVDVGIPGHRLILYPETSKAERDRITKEFSKPYSRRRGASRIPSASPQVAASLRGIKPANGPAFIKLTKRLANPLRDHVRVQGGKMIVLEGQDSPTNVLGVTATRVGHEFSSQSFGKISDGVYRIEGGKLVEPTAREESIPGSQIFNEVDGTRLSADIDADALLADIGKVLAIMGSSATTDLSSIALSVNPDRSIGMAALVTNEKGDIVGVSETNIQEGSKAVGAVFGQSLLDTARLHTAAGATKFTLRMNNKVLELSSIGSQGTIGRSHLMLMKSDTRSIEDRLRSEGVRFMRERFNKASIRRLLDSISALDESGAIRTAMFWEMSNLERAIQRYREELGELADDLNPAELYQLAGGKRIDMVERFDREEIRPFEEKVADLAKRSGMSELEVRDLIQEYAYVVHARDANTELQQRSETERRARAQAKRNGVTEVLEGDELEAMLEQMSKLGISNEEAIERQKQLDAEFDRIGGDWAGAVEMLRSMNRRTLEMRRDAGLITQASYDTLIKRYPSYVPIVRSVFGEEGEVDAGTSRPKKREMRSLRGGNEATGRTFWAASYAITKHDRLVTAHRIAMNEGHMAFWELAMQGALKMQDGTSLADAVFVDQIVQDAVRRARATGSTRTGEDGKPVKASEFDQGVEVGKAITEATADIDSRMMRGENESPDTVRFKLTRDVDLTDPQVLRDIEDVTSSKDGLTSEERAEGMKPRTQKQREKKLEQLERQKLVYKKGSAMHFRINDPILANAMLNRTPTMMQRAQEKGGLVGKMSNAWMALMNYQRFAYVTASPGFIVGEMFRSPQQVAIMARVLADKYRLPREQAEQLFRNLELEYAKMFFTVPVVGAARSAPFVSSSWKSAKHILRGGKPRDEYEELIAEAIEAGVLQGGIFNVDSYEQMSAKLRREIADLADGTTKSHRKHGRLSKAGQFAGWVEMVTTALDMSNRMQLYRAAREAGLSKQKAAVMARESTIDFGKKGSFNRGANELYLFFNPRMQGIHQLLRAFKQTSRGRLSTTAAVLGRYFLYAFLLKMVVEMFFEDDENPDTWLGKFASMQNTIIPIPGTESENGQYMYFEINNPYGFGAIAKLAYRFGDVLMGDSRPGDLIVGGVGDVMSELTPVQFDGMQLLKGKREGLESFLAAVTPTNFQPLVSAFMNRDWKGAPIAPLGPEFGAGENRESLDYWPDTMRTSIWASQGIAELTGVIMRALQGPQARGVEISPNKLGYIFERYLPGVARQFGDLIKTVGQMSDGTRRGIGSVPVVNLVIGQSGGRSVMPGRFRDDLATIAANLDQDIKADGLAPTLKRYGNLSWLAGPEFSAAKRQLKKLQEARNNATERGDRVRATKLEDRMNEIRKRMLIRAAKMRNR